MEIRELLDSLVVDVTLRPYEDDSGSAYLIRGELRVGKEMLIDLKEMQNSKKPDVLKRSADRLRAEIVHSLYVDVISDLLGILELSDDEFISKQIEAVINRYNAWRHLDV